MCLLRVNFFNVHCFGEDNYMCLNVSYFFIQINKISCHLVVFDDTTNRQPDTHKITNISEMQNAICLHLDWSMQAWKCFSSVLIIYLNPWSMTWYKKPDCLKEKNVWKRCIMGCHEWQGRSFEVKNAMLHCCPFFKEENDNLMLISKESN